MFADTGLFVKIEAVGVLYKSLTPPNNSSESQISAKASLWQYSIGVSMQVILASRCSISNGLPSYECRWRCLGFLVEQRAKHWAKPAAWFGCRLEISFNKDCSVIPPILASAEFFYQHTTLQNLWWRQPRNNIGLGQNQRMLLLIHVMA